MNDYQPGGMSGEYHPMRREHDRISLIEARVRAALLGGQPPRGTAPLTLSFVEAVRLAVADVTSGLHELLVEVWLRNLPPWAEGGDESALGCITSTTIFTPAAQSTGRTIPDDILLATVTAGRPLRFDDALDHPLVRAWATNGGIDPDMVGAFMGIPLFRGGQSLGVLAVALPQAPSPEHATFLDALGYFIATGAEVARLGHQLHAQRALAQTVLREAPLAAAVLRAADNVIIFTNPRFDDLLQIGPDVWGQELDVVLPDHAGQLRTTFKLDEVRRSGSTQLLIDLPIRLPSGVEYWDFTCSPIRDERGALEDLLLVGVNVTARVAQRERQKRNVDQAQERVSQMVELHRVSLEVASQLGQDPTEVLRLILGKMVALVQATGGVIWYADRERGDLEGVVSVGLPRDYTGQGIPRGAGLPGRVAITGESQRVDDYRNYPLRTAEFDDPAFRAVAAVPMQQRSQVIGVIGLVKTAASVAPKHPDEAPPATFSEDDIWLLELFAVQAAHAIENTRTYLDMERAYQQQRALDRQKDDFIARASHDLRLPLTSVVGYLDLALEMLPQMGGEDVRHLLQTAADEAQRMKELMDQLLEQARLDDGKRAVHLAPVALAAVVTEVVAARRKQVALHGTPYQFSVSVAPDLTVMADLARLQEILENVLSNAVKYSPKGGQIQVEAHQAGERVEMRISDQGIGIPPDAHGQIFERFTRVDSPVASAIGGTGLGLYLARQLAESMGGTIALERSAPDQGSVFLVMLPC